MLANNRALKHGVMPLNSAQELIYKLRSFAREVGVPRMTNV